MAGIENMAEPGPGDGEPAPSAPNLTPEQVQMLGFMADFFQQAMSNPQMLQAWVERLQRGEAQQPRPSDLTPEQRRQLETLAEKYSKTRVKSAEELRHDLSLDKSEPIKGISVDVGKNIKPPGSPESGPSTEISPKPERKEYLPPLSEVVSEYRRLEALSAEERYDPGPDNSYPNLRALEAYTGYIREYASRAKEEDKMNKPIITGLKEKLKYYTSLENILADPNILRQQKLESLSNFIGTLKDPDTNQTWDPILSGTIRKIKILEGLKYPSSDQRLLLNDFKEQRDNLLIVQSTIQKLQARNQALEAKRSEAGGLEADEEQELITNQEALEDYEANPNNPNRLLQKVRDLDTDEYKRDPAMAAALLEVLRDVLEQQTDQVYRELLLHEETAITELLNKEKREPNEMFKEDWLIELEELDELREQAAENIEKFVDLPSFNEVKEARDQAEANNDQNALDLANARLERYFYNAKKQGIITELFSDFYTFLRDLRIPKITHYGDIIPVDENIIARAVMMHQSKDSRKFFTDNTWDFDKFGGVLKYATERANKRMANALTRMRNPSAAEEEEYLRGEWNLDREERRVLDESRSGTITLFEHNYYGSYQFRIDPDSPFAKQQLEIAGDQWVLHMQSGVVSKQPQEQLQEWQHFIKMWEMLAFKVYERVYNNRDDINAEVTRLRRQFKFRVEAPIAAYFNDVDEAENFSKMRINLDDELESPEVWMEGYKALNATPALVLHHIENNPLFSRVFFHPEGSRGYLGRNPEQKIARAVTEEQLIDYIAGKEDDPDLPGFSLSSSTVQGQAVSSRLHKEMDNILEELEANENKPIERRRLEAIRKKKLEEIRLDCIANRKINLRSVGLDKPVKDFLSLYGKFTEQPDYIYANEEEKVLMKKARREEVKAAVELAKNIMNMTAEHSSRAGPTIKIRNSGLLALDNQIENLREELAKIDEAVSQNRNFEFRTKDGEYVTRWVLDIKQEEINDVDKDAAKRRHSELVRKHREWAEQRKQKAEALKAVRVSRKELAREKKNSGVLDRREDRVPVMMVNRSAQYAVFRAEELWAKEADRIMKDPNIADKDAAIQKLCSDIIPDEWNIKKEWVEANNLPSPKLNLTDVLEGVWRRTLDTVFRDGLRAKIEVPVIVGQGNQRNIQWRKVTGSVSEKGEIIVDHGVDHGRDLTIEDIERIPESIAVLMPYFASEQTPSQVLTARYRIEQAKARATDVFSRSLRILDPAFNRFYREDDPEYFDENYQQLKQALHSAVETQWQRHFQIDTEIMERCVIGANIRRNKTGKRYRLDRYKVIDGNPGNNLLVFGEDTRYVTSRIINHKAYVLTDPERRSRRGPVLAAYSPIQKKDMYTEAGVRNSREFFGLIGTESAEEYAIEGPRIDFVWLQNQQGRRWESGYKLRLALESGPGEQGKQWIGLFEKVYTSADRLNKLYAEWERHEEQTRVSPGDPAVQAKMEILKRTLDAEWENFITMAEDVDTRLRRVLDELRNDLSFLRFTQGAVWKDGVDTFLPDGILNFKMDELVTIDELGRRERDTLSHLDEGTSRHTGNTFYEIVNQWRQDLIWGLRLYPGSKEFIARLNELDRIFGQDQTGAEIEKGRVVS